MYHKVTESATRVRTDIRKLGIAPAENGPVRQNEWPFTPVAKLHQLVKLAGWTSRIIPPLFAIWKKLAGTRYTYTVVVDDNFHYTDESERYTSGTFRSLEAAIEACRNIVDDFINESCKEIQPSSDALYENYVAFGPDPFIVTDDPRVRPVPFSAWTYAREQCLRRFGNAETPE